jgi:hypothetical protein
MLQKMLKEKEVGKYVTEKNGDITVDWQGIENINIINPDSFNADLHQNIMDYLVEKKILSPNPDGKYSMVSTGLSLNPRYGPCELFFTREEDVRKYKKARFENAEYQVNIHKIKVIE